MKSSYWLSLLAAAGTILTTSSTLHAANTDSLHFNFQTAMTSTNAANTAFGHVDASGKVAWSLTIQGNVDTEQLTLSLAHLDTNTLYLLTAFIGDDTNAISITEFTTDSKGAATLKYSDNGQVRNTQALPETLDPLCNVRELGIVNGDLNTVLSANLTNPDKGQYLVKRTMFNTGFTPGAAGSFQINAIAASAQFQLQASGLAINTAYWLSLNGDIVQTNTSDKNGRLTLKALPPGSPQLLDLQTVTLTDGVGTNVVLISTGLGVPCFDMGAELGVLLGSTTNFAVLAGSTVTSTGLSVINGDLGVSPGSAVVGFPSGIVNGTIHADDLASGLAQVDLTIAYNDAAGRTLAPVSVAGNLGGLTLPPGLYKSTSSLEISSGDLTLDAQGDVNAVWIFQIASTLTTTSGRQVILSGGAKASNVFWQVGSSATLGTTTAFKGTIMASQSIALQTGATLDGRALASVGAVTMQSNTVTTPAP